MQNDFWDLIKSRYSCKMIFLFGFIALFVKMIWKEGALSVFLCCFCVVSFRTVPKNLILSKYQYLHAVLMLKGLLSSLTIYSFVVYCTFDELVVVGISASFNVMWTFSIFSPLRFLILFLSNWRWNGWCSSFFAS